MARINLYELPATDLFRNQAMGMQEQRKSLVDIPPVEYRKIVLETEKAFKKPLAKVTSERLNELIDLANEIFESKTSLVARKSLTVTVLVNDIEDTNVSVILRFDDLMAAGDVRTEIFKELTRQIDFGPNIKVGNGILIGSLEMPTKIFVMPKLVVNNDGNRWEHHIGDVNAEVAALRAKRSTP